jgi:hypothetical protein
VRAEGGGRNWLLSSPLKALPTSPSRAPARWYQDHPNAHRAGRHSQGPPDGRVRDERCRFCAQYGLGSSIDGLHVHKGFEPNFDDSADGARAHVLPSGTRASMGSTWLRTPRVARQADRPEALAIDRHRPSLIVSGSTNAIPSWSTLPNGSTTLDSVSLQWRSGWCRRVPRPPGTVLMRFSRR